MNNGDYERSGLLSEEDDRRERTPSPYFDGEENTTPTGKAVPYKQVGILVFANAMVITAFQVIYPFVSKWLRL
ncbi:hypothetical protein FRC12_022835 [Ceratobasidium sp. 428]|nr:hypothetical protein FRC12_022835 [Ceratobasidium sp. 428]